MLVAQTTDSATTRYTQDLVAPLSQVLQLTHGMQRTDYLYSHERLLAQTGTAQPWYDHDALGSVRQTLDATGVPLAALSYDPWGLPQGGATPPTFGFTGELQDGTSGLVYLRARWYQPQQGRFTSRDPFAGFPTQPYSQHPYQYAYSNPVLLRDPTGRCIGWLWGDPTCQFAGTDYTKYDYAGGGQVLVTGLGAAATVVACAGTAGVACVAGAAGAGVVTAWGKQALNNAGQPVGAAATQIHWRQVAVDGAVSGVSGPIGYGTARLARPLLGQITAGGIRATVRGGIVGGSSAGGSRALMNIFDGDPTTGVLEEVLEECLIGGLFGGFQAGANYGLSLRNAEIYVRAVDVDQLARIKASGWSRLVLRGGSGESFISTSRKYVEGLAHRHSDWYPHQLEIYAKRGTLDKLATIGARSDSELTEQLFPAMPLIGKGKSTLRISRASAVY